MIWVCDHMQTKLSWRSGKRPRLSSAQGEGSLLTAGNYFESGKSECNNSGYKLTGLTWCAVMDWEVLIRDSWD